MGKPLVSLAQAKEHLNMRAGDATHDLTVEAMLEAITDIFEQETDRIFERQIIVEKFDTRNRTRSIVDLYGTSETGETTRTDPAHYTLKGIAPVIMDGIALVYLPLGATTETTLAENRDFTVDWIEMTISVYRHLGNFQNALTVTYTSGYETQEIDGTDVIMVPAPVRLAALSQLSYLWKRNNRDNIGGSYNVAHGGDQSRNRPMEWNVSKGVCMEAQTYLRSLKRPLMGRG